MKKTAYRPGRANVQLIKAINEGAVLKLVRDHGPLSRSQIARETGLTNPTVASILESLTAQGVVLPVGLGSSTGGRKPLLFQFNPDAALVIGIDVGATKMTGGLTNLSGKLLARQTITRDDGPEDPYQRLTDLIRSLLDRAPESIPVRGIGVGVAGVTNLAQGVVTLAPGLGWSNFPLGARLEQEFGLPVFLDNDVNTILLGEHWFGAARDVADVLCVAIGSGIGASILMDGRLYRGAREAAGEVGYFATDMRALQGPAVSPTSYGFLEQEAAGPGIARRGNRAMGREVTAPEVMQLAREGHPAAMAVVEETARHLGLAIANMAVLLNPELVILTGGVMRAADLLLEPITAAVHHLVPYPPQIQLSELKEEAGVLGAVALVLESGRTVISG